MSMRLFRVVPCWNENENADHAWHSGQSAASSSFIVILLLHIIVLIQICITQRKSCLRSDLKFVCHIRYSEF